MAREKDYIDFPNTCPYIDDSITGVISDLEEFISDIFEDLGLDCKSGYPLKKSEEFYKSSIEKHFEDVRRLNSKLRDQATDQLKNIIYENSDLKEENVRLEKRESDLEYEINVLRERISELEESAQDVRDR